MNFNQGYFKKSIIKENFKKMCAIFPKGWPNNLQKKAIPPPFWVRHSGKINECFLLHGRIVSHDWKVACLNRAALLSG